MWIFFIGNENKSLEFNDEFQIITMDIFQAFDIVCYSVLINKLLSHIIPVKLYA